MRLLLLLVLAALPATVRAQSSATFRGADVYRSATLGDEQLSPLRSKLVLYVELRDSRRRADAQAAEKLKKELLAQVGAMGEFAYLDLYYGQYVTSADHTAFLTFDAVDKADAASRMPFRAAPAGRVPDPAGSLAAWEQYLAEGARARRIGAATYDRPQCPGFYCTYGSQTPELAALEKRLVEGAELHRKSLASVVEKETDPKKRAAAVYVLSYGKDGAALVADLAKALQDPDAQVRSAALEVFSDIALYHREVAIDPTILLPALDFPATSDRARALGVFVGLADDPVHQEFVKKYAGRRLVRLLKQGQPNIHDLAYTILSLVSKESFGRRDYDKWSGWVEAQAAP